ncbi:PREDICTED: cytochrome c oxidase assembly protein COX16 homolog, mitochondrial-like isoform X2 [Priapulus caudatus]|nr:PREDICTED: cytochrome c oxidase assembly protein COX16 homolog, mitochondrial-like isoform X2 [Priapulus caudatus]XP_014667736.1 PREDICTED: cytochrome c oxidase assembly protein COX16 homolog, mitochondrial-like isoform X2 [Priapulus caudatus]
MVGGSYWLKGFTGIRYQFRQVQSLKPEDLEDAGIEKKSVTLESEFEKVQNLDIDTWENKRGPRPWEEQQQQQQQ